MVALILERLQGALDSGVGTGPVNEILKNRIDLGGHLERFRVERNLVLS
jgi:hypothetical protein